jgi:nucleoside-diphosphate-sugar epimerase
MKTVGIVGASGFIGSHLSTRYGNVRNYGRENISDLANDDSDLVIIAAAPATKWLANSNPAGDFENLKVLIKSLKSIGNKVCVLISTIDVFPAGTEFTETQQVPNDHPEGYGFNRGYLEAELNELLPNLHIVRLPGMFGPGLKKNLIFDLMNGKQVSQFNPESTFQFYDVRWLPAHIEMCLEFEIKVANLATEPITVSEIYSSCFSLAAPDNEIPKTRYLMKTIYSNELVGRDNPFLLSKLEVLASMQEWISSNSK